MKIPVTSQITSETEFGDLSIAAKIENDQYTA